MAEKIYTREVFAVSELKKQLKPPSMTVLPPSGPIIRETIFSLGESPQVLIENRIVSPNIFNSEILLDGLKNLYTYLEWRVERTYIDSGEIIGFNIYRKEIKTDTKPETIDTFNKMTYGSTRTGKFSADRKVISNVDRGLIPKEILNNNLSLEEQNARARYVSTGDVDVESLKLFI